MLLPRTFAPPFVGRVSPRRSLIVVVFPAPFGPRNAKIEFFGTLRLSCFKALTSP